MPVQPSQPPSAPPTPESVVTAPVEKSKLPLDPKSILSSFKGFNPKDIMTKFNFKKLVKPAIIVFVVLVVLMVGLTVLRRFNGPAEEPALDIPTPTPVPIVDIQNPSEYAEDTEVLELEDRILQLERDLDGATLNESQLQPPSHLDFNVSFK